MVEFLNSFLGSVCAAESHAVGQTDRPCCGMGGREVSSSVRQDACLVTSNFYLLFSLGPRFFYSFGTPGSPLKGSTQAAVLQPAVSPAGALPPSPPTLALHPEPARQQVDGRRAPLQWHAGPHFSSPPTGIDRGGGEWAPHFSHF